MKVSFIKTFYTAMKEKYCKKKILYFCIHPFSYISTIVQGEKTSKELRNF